MRIPESTLSEIRDRVDIAEVVGEHVALQRKGGRYWGLCPFHQEKSPSFTVTPDKGVFYCFGCHKGGTVFDFVMEVEKIDWRDAVEVLAKKAGIEIPHEEEDQGGVKRDTFFELYRRVAGSFHWLLLAPAGESALRYLRQRGVSAETMESFQLGYAPPDREWLFKFLTSKSYSPEFLARIGLFMDTARGKGSLFADRIMFPISNARGEILAFGGRSLGDAQPKYLNSPETAYFRKGENLFGMDKAAAAIRAAGVAIVVEGYMDVMAMHQAGWANCVAPLGTALTERQVRLLRRYASRVLLLFDGDAAGQKASERAIEMLERQDLFVQVVELPGGQDPADFVQKGEVPQLRAIVEKPHDSFPWLLGKALEGRDRNRAEEREGIRDRLFPFIAAPASQLRKDGYLTQLAESLAADVQVVRDDFAAWQGRGRFGGHRPGRAEQETEERSIETRRLRQGAMSTDLFLMLAVAANQALFQEVRKGGIGLSDLEDERARTLFVALEEAFRADEQGFEAVCERIEDADLRDLAIRKVSSGEFELNQERMVSDGVKRIRRRTLEKKADLLMAEMRKADREGCDAVRMEELLTEKKYLDGELERLKTGAARA